MVKEINLTNSDEIVIIDDEDYEFVIQWNWQLLKAKYGKLITRCQYINGLNITIYLHKEIAKRIGLDISNEIDHIDRNNLNIKRNNLRAATRSQNSMNKGLQSNNTIGYKGVCYHHKANKYEAYIKYKGLKMYLGLFKTIEEAAKAYDKAAKCYHKEFAVLNFPE